MLIFCNCALPLASFDPLSQQSFLSTSYDMSGTRVVALHLLVCIHYDDADESIEFTISADNHKRVSHIYAIYRHKYENFLPT